MAHTFGGQGLTDAITAGVDTIEHGQGLTQELASMMVQKGLYYDPTIVRYTLASIEASDREKTAENIQLSRSSRRTFAPRSPPRG